MQCPASRVRCRLKARKVIVENIIISIIIIKKNNKKKHLHCCIFYIIYYDYLQKRVETTFDDSYVINHDPLDIHRENISNKKEKVRKKKKIRAIPI